MPASGEPSAGVKPDRPAGGRPETAQSLFASGVERQRIGDLKGAAGLYVRAVEMQADLGEAWGNLAVALRGLGHDHAALAAARRAVALRPDIAAHHGNLGAILRHHGLIDEAVAAGRRAVALSPDDANALHNLGLALRSAGLLAEAVEAYDRALALRPSFVQAEWDRAFALLQMGDYAKGFAAYESRWQLKELKPRELPMPLWRGEELAGKRLLVHAEQGLGDTIQFARVLPLLAQRGGDVVFECQPELVRLIATLPGAGTLVPRGAKLPEADFQVPLLSLPHRLGTTLATVPPAPYLKPPVERPDLPVAAGIRLKVGIAWAGKPTHKNDRNRSATLEPFLALADLPGLGLYGLQVGPRAADIAAAGAGGLVRDLAPRIRDFADTAGLLMQLDLVVTVDSALAHLAGALGRPALVLLPHVCDWRWLAQRTDSPWYPSLTLVRQERPGDWEGVMRRVGARLEERLAAAG